MQISLAGETLELHPDRAAYWAASRTLLLADVHLGKGAACRRVGIPAPMGASRADLARIDALIAQFQPARLLVLGDLFHAAVAPKDPTIAAFDEFRESHPGLVIQSIRRKNDHDIMRLPVSWKINWIDGALVEGGFVFNHSPEADERGYGLAGHIHPAVKLSACNSAPRLPIFWFQPQFGVLPAFGGLTGSYTIVPKPFDRIVVATPEGLLQLDRSERIPEARVA